MDGPTQRAVSAANQGRQIGWAKRTCARAKRVSDTPLKRASKRLRILASTEKADERDSPHCSDRLLRHAQTRKPPSLDSVELLGRLAVGAVSLPAHGKAHRVLPAAERPDRAVVRNVGAARAAQVLLEDEVRERVGRKRGRVARGQVGRRRGRGGGGGGRGGGEGEGAQGSRGSRSGGGRREERREGVELGLGEIRDAHLVVELEARHDASRGVVVDTVEGEERNLKPRRADERRSTTERLRYTTCSSSHELGRAVRTLTSLRSGRVAPRRLTTARRQRVSRACQSANHCDERY